MKQVFLKILKVFLVIVAVLLAILLVFGIVLSLGWPWWVGLFILLGLLGLGFGMMFFRKVWLRQREQHFVSQVIEQDESYLRTLGDKERERSRELQDRWKEAIEALKASHLRKYGNPLYVLPWYLVIGESGSGKTTAIKSARLSSPFAEISRTSGISGTRNCDWWFFDQAIIIDTAGRYAIPVDEGRDKEEWQRFLTILAKYRKREPLNGVSVTIAADKLLDSRPEALEEDGRIIRRRIDELMLVLGARFPVYVLVSKCDLVQGMTQFCDYLPDKSHDQALGLLNHQLSTDVTAFSNRAINTIGERLRDLRLLFVNKPGPRGVGQGIDPGLLLFPEEFERLKPGLNAFIKGAFQENPYQETPILRGLFFSSGRQEGSPHSHFLKALGLIEEREVLPGTSKGLFLHDFFARILPKDRGLFAPTQRALGWSRLTRNLGLTSWVTVAIAICGLLSFSFVKNLGALRDVSHEFSKPPVLQGEILTDIITMNRFRQAILRVEDQNRNWWIPRFGLNESKNVESKLRAKYCKQFKGGFLASLDKQMADRMANFSDSTSPDAIFQHVDHLVKRINLLQALLEGNNLETLQAMSQPSYEPIVLMADQKLIPEIRQKFADLYLYFLVWRQDSSSLNQEMNNLQTWLKHILTLKPTNLNWLAAWVNNNPSLHDLNLGDFWGGSLSVSDETTVPPSFTGKGKEQIDSFLKEIEAALPDPLIIASQKLEFKRWYSDAYVEAWYNLGNSFSKGIHRLNSKEEWQQAAATMAADEGPYFSLLERMAAELEPFAVQEDMPPWMKLVYEFKAIRDEADREEALKKKGALAKATSTGKKLVTKLERKKARLEKGMTLEAQLIAAKAFREYRSALAEITPVSASRRLAYQMAAKAFSEDSATSKSPFFVAQNAVSTLKASLARVKSDQKMFWNLVIGPLDYLWAFVCQETACHINDLWEKGVLVEVQGVSDKKLVNQLLFGQDGYAMKFINGPAAPFVSRSLRKGFYAREVLGRKIPFKDSFFTFITEGAIAAKPKPAPEPEPVKTNYIVSIKGLPTDTNKDAQVRPHATNLEIKCTDKSLRLDNLNYPVSKTFDWSPQNCGDVIFKIKVGNLILTRNYTGDLAFPRFLKDFSKGHRVFFPSEFPKEQAALRRMGIKYIKVKYELTGHRPVLGLLTSGKPTKVVSRAPRVPEDIVRCWDH
jgi:type VI secretion system protein ImpL